MAGFASTPEGELQFHFYAMLAQYERSKICERTMAGLAAARARGRTGGRPRKLNGKQAELAAKMLKDPETSIDEVCEAFPNVSRRTLYRRAQEARSAASQQPETVQ